LPVKVPLARLALESVQALGRTTDGSPLVFLRGTCSRGTDGVGIGRGAGDQADRGARRGSGEGAGDWDF